MATREELRDTDDWNHTAEIVRFRSAMICELCWLAKVDHVHHRITGHEQRSGYSYEMPHLFDVMAVCHACHAWIHWTEDGEIRPTPARHDESPLANGDCGLTRVNETPGKWMRWSSDRTFRWCGFHAEWGEFWFMPTRQQYAGPWHIVLLRADGRPTRRRNGPRLHDGLRPLELSRTEWQERMARPELEWWGKTSASGTYTPCWCCKGDGVDWSRDDLRCSKCRCVHCTRCGECCCNGGCTRFDA